MASPDFNATAPRSLDSLRANAEHLAGIFFLIQNPAQKLYDRFAAAMDDYAGALAEKYGSLDKYIGTLEQGLEDLAKRKDLPLIHLPILDFDDGLKKKIADLDAALADKGKYFNREQFAELFVIRIPQAVDSLTKSMSAQPDAPTAAATAPTP